MGTNRTNQPERSQADDQSNTIKDPNEWTTGDEPMTGAQRSYLKTLSDEAKEPFDDRLTKAEASQRIDELQEKRGAASSGAEKTTGRRIRSGGPRAWNTRPEAWCRV